MFGGMFSDPTQESSVEGDTPLKKKIPSISNLENFSANKSCLKKPVTQARVLRNSQSEIVSGGKIMGTKNVLLANAATPDPQR